MAGLGFELSFLKVQVLKCSHQLARVTTLGDGLYSRQTLAPSLRLVR
jgi:hypothetical protein